MHIMYFDVYTVRQASDQGLHCLPLIQQILQIWTVSKNERVQMSEQVW